MMAQKCGNRHHYYFRTAFITVPSSQLIATSSANSRNGNPTHSSETYPVSQNPPTAYTIKHVKREKYVTTADSQLS